MKDHPKPNLVKTVMKQINSGQVKMRPRGYFVVGSILAGVGLIMFFLLAVFFFSLFFFHLDKVGLARFLTNPWRWRAWEVFPWWSLAGALLSLLVGGWLLKRYDIAYKLNYFGLLGGLILVALGFGYFLNLMGLGRWWQGRSCRFGQSFPSSSGDFRLHERKNAL